MKTFFVSLCAFALINGIIRGFVNDSKFSRYYGLISGVMILLIIVSNLHQIDLHTDLDSASEAYADNGDYEEAVLGQAQNRLCAMAEQKIYAQYGVACKVDISLQYTDDEIHVSRVDIYGISDSDEIRLLLKDYFETEDGVIHFHR